MTSYEHIFNSQLPTINHDAWLCPAEFASTEDERIMEEDGWEVMSYQFKVPALAQFDVEAFDPGYAHMGICTIRYGTVTLYQCDIKAGKQYTKPSGPRIAQRIYDLYLALPDVGYAPYNAIENAAFGKSNGQANLGLVRGIIAGLVIGRGNSIVFYSPNEYKKLIHGTTKVDYHKLSKHYPDAVAAFAMALARCKQREVSNGE